MSITMNIENEFSKLRQGDTFEGRLHGEMLTFQYARPRIGEEVFRDADEMDEPKWTGWVTLVDSAYSPFVGFVEVCQECDVCLNGGAHLHISDGGKTRHLDPHILTEVRV